MMKAGKRGAQRRHPINKNGAADLVAMRRSLEVARYMFALVEGAVERGGKWSRAIMLACLDGGDARLGEAIGELDRVLE